MPTIYRVTRKLTGECYIGSTSLKALVRWGQHLYLLRLGDHHARGLQRAFDADGEEGLLFEVVEECVEDDRYLREQHHIDNSRSDLNVNRFAQKNGKFGYKLTDEQLARCSAGQTGLKRPSSVANAAFARVNSPANKPGWVPEHRIGMKDTPEVIEKRRLATIAALAENPTIWITDGNENIRHPVADPIPENWRQGRTFPADHKAAMLASSSGPRSAEVKANIKAGHANTWNDPAKRAAMLTNRRPYGWWTDGVTSKRVHDDETPPDGWRPGRTTGWKCGRKPAVKPDQFPTLDLELS